MSADPTAIAAATYGLVTTLIVLFKDEIGKHIPVYPHCRESCGAFIGPVFFLHEGQTYTCHKCFRIWSYTDTINGVKLGRKRRIVINEFNCPACNTPIVITKNNNGKFITCANGHPKIEFHAYFDEIHTAHFTRITGPVLSWENLPQPLNTIRT